MNKILLVNRIDPRDYSNTQEKVFFLIGGMEIASIENRLVDTIKKSQLIKPDDMVLKYNGVELNISVQQIPIMVELFTKANISIYGIYQIYNPDK